MNDVPRHFSASFPPSSGSARRTFRSADCGIVRGSCVIKPISLSLSPSGEELTSSWRGPSNERTPPDDSRVIKSRGARGLRVGEPRMTRRRGPGSDSRMARLLRGAGRRKMDTEDTKRNDKYTGEGEGRGERRAAI